MKNSASVESFQLNLDSVFNIALIGDESVRTTLYNSLLIGANTVVKNASGNSVTQDKNKGKSPGTTEPWTAEARIEMNNKNVRIRFYDSYLGGRNNGVVFLIDASNNESFQKYREQLSKLWTLGTASKIANTPAPITFLSLYPEGLSKAIQEDVQEMDSVVPATNDEAKEFAGINSIAYFENIVDAFENLITEILLNESTPTHPQYILEKSTMFRLAEKDFYFKIIMLGDPGVGKTNLMTRFVSDEFSLHTPPVIGIDFKHRPINIDNKKVVSCIFDTNTTERFLRMLTRVHHLLVGAVLVYDITKYSTFQNIPYYLNGLREKADKDVVMIIVGNKNDLQVHRAVTSEEGEEFARENNLLFIETSALDGRNVDKMFRSLLTDIYYKIRSSEALNEPMFLNVIYRPRPRQTEKDEDKAADTKKDRCRVM